MQTAVLWKWECVSIEDNPDKPGWVIVTVRTIANEPKADGTPHCLGTFTIGCRADAKDILKAGKSYQVELVPIDESD